MSSELRSAAEELHSHTKELSKHRSTEKITAFLVEEYNKLLHLAREEEPDSIILQNLSEANMETTYEDLTLMCAQMQQCIYLDPPVIV